VPKKPRPVGHAAEVFTEGIEYLPDSTRHYVGIPVKDVLPKILEAFCSPA